MIEEPTESGRSAARGSSGLKLVALMAALMATAVIVGVALVSEVPNSLSCVSPEDFPNYYFGGQRVLEGGVVYEPLAEDVLAGLGCEGYEAYPADAPPTVVLLAPLSLLRYEVAWWALLLISAAIVSFVTMSTAREVGFGRPMAITLGIGALATHPSLFLLVRNHMESLVLLAGFLGWKALRREGVGGTGLWWGVATALKLFPGLWLLGLWGDRRRETMIGFSTAATLLIVGGAVVGADDIARFVTEILPSSRRWLGVAGNYSLLSVGTALGGPVVGWLLTGLAAVILVPVYLGGVHDPDRAWVGGSALALLLSPLAWLNYLILVLPCLVIAAARLDLRDRSNEWLLFGVAMGLAWWPSIVSWEGLVPTVLLSSVPTWALLALFWMAHRRFERPQQEQRVGEQGLGNRE